MRKNIISINKKYNFFNIEERYINIIIFQKKDIGSLYYGVCVIKIISDVT